MALGTALVLATAALAPATAAAQAPQDRWEFGLILYGYLPDLKGTTNFPTGAGPSVNVDASKIISNLQFTFMGFLEARKGPWGAFTDFMYVDLDGSKSNTREFGLTGLNIPASVTANADLDVKALVWTLAGEYRVIAKPEYTMDVFAGARLLDLKQTLNLQLSSDIGPFVGPSRQVSSEVSFDNWDAIVGVKGRANFGPNREWFIPWYLDVGGGESKLTWQAIGGIGYHFSWGELLAAWRYLDYEFKSSQKVSSLSLNGPAIGVAFRW